MQPQSVESAALEASRWSKTLVGLHDPSVRVGWVRSRILGTPLDRVCDVLTVVLARAEQRDERATALLLCVSLALAEPGMSSVRSALAQLAETRGQWSVHRLFARPQDDRGVGGTLDDEDAPPKALAAGPSGGRPLTLGERKSLARRRDRQLLARALRDPHPDVIAVLLDNPALVEADVVRLCARRPVAPEVLEQVFRHRRWVVRPTVRRTLALNPHTPETIALQLLPHLTSADLRDVAASLQLSARVREACAPEASERLLH